MPTDLIRKMLQSGELKNHVSFKIYMPKPEIYDLEDLIESGRRSILFCGHLNTFISVHTYGNGHAFLREIVLKGDY